MHPLRAILYLGLSLAILPCFGEVEDLEILSLSNLEDQLNEIDRELENIAYYSLRGGIGSIGYRSKDYSDPDHVEWVKIELGETTTIDQIILVPTIWRDFQEGLINDGFPSEFNIYAGKTGDTEGTLIARFTKEDNFLPRIGPLAINCPDTEAGWVKIEATKLSTRAHDRKYIFQLSEVMVFRDSENVALHKPVIAPRMRTYSHTWNRRFLVDGFTPYIMNSTKGERSLACVIRVPSDTPLTLEIDLEKEHTLTSIHLHAVEQSDTVPQSVPGDFGMPNQFTLEGANKADFSDAFVIVEREWKTITDKGPIMIVQFPSANCRYVRVIAKGPYLSVYGEEHIYRFGFAEIELFSAETNVAYGKAFTPSKHPIDPLRPLSHLTDNLNLYGQILPIKDWINQLARRHDLEVDRPIIAEEIQGRYERQTATLRIVAWLAALLAVGIAFTILLNRMLRMREISSIRERFAADLHDELGANIHTIGLLGDVALKSLKDPERLKTVLERNRRLTESTGTAVRHCINLQEAEGLYGNLPDDMKRISRRILVSIKYDIEIQGGEHLEKLNPKERTDLELFYKECLVNVSRHADATECKTQLIATAKEINLSVLDNGRGIQKSLGTDSPNSLKRRAKLLGATTKTEHPPSGGTLIRLTYRPGKFRLFRK